MENKSLLSRDLLKSCTCVFLLTVIYLLNFLNSGSYGQVFLSLPFFVLLYFFFFSLGQPSVVAFLQNRLGSEVKKAILFPVLLLVLYAVYLMVNGQAPFKDLLALFPFLILFPVLAFSALRVTEPTKINWFDFFVFTLFLLPTTLVNVQPKGELPFNGGGFDSVYRIVIMLVAVYSFSVIRNVDGVGFFPELNRKKLWTALLVWALFYGFVLTLGMPIGFIRFVGHESVSFDLIQSILLTLLLTFLHTAIFEELFFRGILLNMLSKRIGQSETWKTFWGWGFALLTLLALLVGYTLKGSLHWFPALMVLLIFFAAFFIERSGKHNRGVYTSLAITSALFGLVHYHSGAIIYIGFACVAGWAYGYTYLKTRNVFYSALVHTLVNSSALIFGLELVR